MKTTTCPPTWPPAASTCPRLCNVHVYLLYTIIMLIRYIYIIHTHTDNINNNNIPNDYISTLVGWQYTGSTLVV